MKTEDDVQVRRGVGLAGWSRRLEAGVSILTNRRYFRD